MTSPLATSPLAPWAASREGLGTLLLPPTRALPIPRVDPSDPALEPILAAAREGRGRAWTLPAASAYARYWTDGDRAEYEAQVFGGMHRLALAALAAAALPEDPRDRSGSAREALAEVADGVAAICQWSTWCWPAHEEAHAREGWVLPDVDNPTLDLGAGEMAALLTWTDVLLGSRLEESFPGLRARIRREVEIRVLHPFEQRTDWHWLGIERPPHNWLAWITQNLLTTAVGLLEPGQRRTGLVGACLELMDRYLASIPSDGAIDEGVSYWWAGAMRALEALEVASEATGGALDPAALPQVAQIVAFGHRMQVGSAWSASFSDASPRIAAGRDGHPWHVLHRWGRRLGDRAVVAYASAARAEPLLDASALPPSGSLGRMLGALGDTAWRRARPEPAPLPRSVWLASTQVWLARERAGCERGLTVVAKGGHNGEAHNHLDLGSVSIALDGVPVVVDLGRATYRAGTFGPDRYAEWHISSQWHSVPAPGGAVQGVGQEFATVAGDVDEGSAWLDLSGVYPDFAGGWQRSVHLEGPGLASVTDRWSGAGGASRIGWVLAGEVVLEGGCAVVHPMGGERTMRIRWEGEVSASLVTHPTDDPYLREAWGGAVTRLDLVASAGDGQVRTIFEAAGP